MHHKERTPVCASETSTSVTLTTWKKLPTAALDCDAEMTHTAFLTTAGHETVQLVRTQIGLVMQKAPLAQVLGVRALSHRLNNFLWICHWRAAASASCPGDQEGTLKFRI